MATTEATADSITDSLAEVEIDVEDEEEKSGEKADLSAIAEEDDDSRKVRDPSQSDDDEDGGSAFPDTNIDIKYSEGGEVKVLARGISESSDPKSRTVSISEQQQQQDEEVRFVVSFKLRIFSLQQVKCSLA